MSHARKLRKEYWGVKERYMALAKLMGKADSGTAILPKGMDLDLVLHQEKIMLEYIKVLEERAKSEGVDLFCYGEVE